MDEGPRSTAFARLAEARAALKMAEALGSLADRASLDAARRDVAAAQEELDKHLTMTEWMEQAVGEALAPKPKPEPIKKPEPVPERDNDREEDDYER